MRHAAADREHAANALIADHAGQRRPDRKHALDHIEIVHVDRRVFDTNQHLACRRARRFRNVGEFEHVGRFAKGLDQCCTHG